MNSIKQISNNVLMRITLLLMVSYFISSNATKAQSPCPAGGNVPYTGVPSSLPSEKFFCEGVTNMILDPGISTPVNYRWYKFNANTNNWNDLNITSSSLPLSNKNTDVGKYTVCWQQGGNTGVYSSDEIEVKEKVFLDEVNLAGEFKLPNGATQVFTCSNSLVQPFTSAGDPKYSYRWGQPTGFSDVNLKNATFTLPSNSYSIAAKGAPNTGSFPIPLIITDKANGCVVQQNITLQIYPFLGPEFARLPDAICQNNLVDPEVRVFMITGYDIQSATVKVGTDPIVNYSGTAFVSTDANKLAPPENTLGRRNATTGNDAPITGTTKVKVLKIPLSASQTGSIPITFSMVTDKGCVGSVTKTVTVNPSPIYTIEMDASNPTKNSFCINDSPIGPLKSNPATAGTFTGTGVTGDATNGFFFNPRTAGAGNFNITFAVNTATPGACAGGGSINVTVRPAPTPRLAGKTVVCPGSINIEYKDSLLLTGGVTRTWSIQNSAGTDISSTTTFVLNGDNINVTFPSPFSETDRKAFVVATNDDAGCSATQKFQVIVDQIQKSPAPKGQTTGCLGSTNTFTYTHGSSANTGFNYQWKVTQGSKVGTSSIIDSASVDVSWNTAAAIGTRTITVTDIGTTTSGVACRIESDPLVVDFINPPVADIRNFQGQAVCAGDEVTLEVLNPVTGITYTWTPMNLKGNDVKFTIPNPYISSTGNFYSYTLTASLTSCPEDSRSQVLVINPTPPDPIPDDLLENCFDDEKIVTITVIPPSGAAGFAVAWSNPVDASNPDPSNNTWNATAPGTYSVKVTNLQSTCSITGEVEIVDVCPAKFFLPAAFSPNGDNTNDSLSIFGKRLLNFDLKIFNRWGEVIFSTKDASMSWDGKVGGLDAPGGVYPYVAVFESVNAKNKIIKNTKEGSVTLIR